MSAGLRWSIGKDSASTKAKQKGVSNLPPTILKQRNTKNNSVEQMHVNKVLSGSTRVDNTLKTLSTSNVDKQGARGTKDIKSVKLHKVSYDKTSITPKIATVEQL